VGFRGGERGRPAMPGEYNAMMRVSRPDFRRLITFLRWTGARPGEAQIATWRDYIPEKGCIELRHHKTAKATGQIRRIMLNRVARGLVEWIRRHYPDPEYIFVTRRGNKWAKSSIANQLKRIRKQAKVQQDATCYIFRHAYATQGILSGLDVATVGELCGHTLISTTARYLHLAGRVDHLKKAVEQISFTP
jgi:integrase